VCSVRQLTAAAALVLLATPPRAHADDAWLNLGASEVLVIPDVAHYAVYGYVAVTLPFDMHWHGVYLIPGLGFELAPEVGHGGLVGYLTAERSLSASVAGDLILTVTHDQPGLAFEEATFAVGVGLGVSIALGSVVLSPSTSVYRSIDAPAWSLAPTLNLAHAF
jgi:hypothetical protein